MKTLTKTIAPVIILIGLFFIPEIASAQTVYGLTSGQNYTVISTYEEDGVEYVVVRNPWGTIEEMEEEEYLTITQKISQDSRQFTMMSNVLEAYHDTSKSYINNMK